MKELFPEFYLDSLEVDDLNSEKNNLIVFDSNFLLDILRLPTEIAEKYLEAIDKVKNHIFVPYLVGVEFNFNKKKVKIETLENVKVYKNQISKLLHDETDRVYENLCESLLKEVKVDFLNNKVHKEQIRNNTKDKLESFHQELLEKQEHIIKDLHQTVDEKYSKDLDELTDRVIELIGNSVASNRCQEWVDKVQEKGDERYKQEIPPGFNDRKGKAGRIRKYSNISYDTQYGDYIIWEEILHEVASRATNIGEKVIFVTSDGNSDKKYDLMYRVKGKTVGPYISMLNEMYELKEGYSIDESDSLGEKLCKTLYIIDGFRFMTLANDLNEEQVRLYEPDKSRVSSISTRDEFILDKSYVNFEKQRNDIKLKRLITITKRNKLQKKLLDADSEESEILSREVRNLNQYLRRLNREMRRLNNIAHMMEQEGERIYNTDQIGLERQFYPVADEEIDLNHEYTSKTEFMILLGEYQKLSRLIVQTKNQIDISTDDLEIQELLNDLQTYEQMIQPIRKKIEEFKTRDGSEDDLI
ncbi:PIN-like domain-containing protein [Streptococcus salivarius]